jgi:hypothetical protein
MTPEEPRIESTEEEPLPNNDQWTRNRRELLEWLGKTSPSLAELYNGAVDLLFGRPVAGFSRFVSHAVREIRNRLPGVASGTGSSGRLDYTSRIDDLSAQGKKAHISIEVKPSEDGRAPSAIEASGVFLPRKVARKVESLIADHDAAHKRP